MAKIIVDPTLTPENSNSRGYILWQDVIYDSKAPKKANKNFEKLVKKGWKLGKSGLPDFDKNHGVGLYKPLNK